MRYLLLLVIFLAISKGSAYADPHSASDEGPVYLADAEEDSVAVQTTEPATRATITPSQIRHEYPTKLTAETICVVPVKADEYLAGKGLIVDRESINMYQSGPFQAYGKVYFWPVRVTEETHEEKMSIEQQVVAQYSSGRFEYYGRPGTDGLSLTYRGTLNSRGGIRPYLQLRFGGPANRYLAGLNIGLAENSRGRMSITLGSGIEHVNKKGVMEFSQFALEGRFKKFGLFRFETELLRADRSRTSAGMWFETVSTHLASTILTGGVVRGTTDWQRIGSAEDGYMESGFSIMAEHNTGEAPTLLYGAELLMDSDYKIIGSGYFGLRF